MTSPKPWGITSAVAASASTSVWGNSLLVTTLSAAATKVVSIYSQTTVPKRRSSFDEPCASALATMTKNQHRGNAFQCADKQVAKFLDPCRAGANQRQRRTDDKADGDAQNQAGLIIPGSHRFGRFRELVHTNSSSLFYTVPGTACRVPACKSRPQTAFA